MGVLYWLADAYADVTDRRWWAWLFLGPEASEWPAWFRR